ncbi:MAG TPA: tripartite tricarboxylate transporter substrate-binding protein, partial [Burkholderiales bacterium]|nr:tripartite tricarboxylate transporter substrate-binding protein [Burkholderiales bacterium]
MMRIRLVLAVCLCGIGNAPAASAAGDGAYPTKPLRLVIPFAAGGTTDLLGRIVGQGIAMQIGQSVVLNNRAGAGGMLGADLVAKAPADGYTLILSNAASHGVAPSIHRKMPYDADRDFAHIALVGLLPQFLVVSSAFPPTTLKELLAEARRSPGKASYGSAGVGSIGNFSGELFKRLAGIDLVHVPYKGTAPATVDLIANRVQIMFQNAPEAAPHIRAGSMRLLAVTGERRSPQFPDAPTFVEEGVKL